MIQLPILLIFKVLIGQFELIISQRKVCNFGHQNNAMVITEIRTTLTHCKIIITEI